MISDQFIIDQIISVQTCNSQSNDFQSVLLMTSWLELPNNLCLLKGKIQTWGIY